MRKLCLLFVLAIGFCCLLSCTKEETIQKDDLEGTWGLVHYESYTTVDGVKKDEQKGDSNPFAPTGDNLMITLIRTVNNKYLVNSFYWNKNTSKWEADLKSKVIWIIKGNKIYIEEGEEYGLGVFTLSSESFSIEWIVEYEYDRIINNNKKTVKEIQYMQYVFRKMSDLLDNSIR